jgi:hypothetical protein
MPDFDVYKYLSEEGKLGPLIGHIRKSARNIAYKFARDDPEALSHDLEIAGWIGFLESNGSMLTAYNKMMNAWTKWTFNRAYKGKTTYPPLTTSLNVPINTKEDDVDYQKIDMLVDSSFNTAEEAFSKIIYHKLKESFAAQQEQGSHKLTQSDVDYIKTSGLSQRVLAKKFNVAKSTIHSVLLKNVYFHEQNKRANQLGLLLDMMIRNGEPVLSLEDIRKIKMDENLVKSRIQQIRETYKKVVGE